MEVWAGWRPFEGPPHPAHERCAFWGGTNHKTNSKHSEARRSAFLHSLSQKRLCAEVSLRPGPEFHIVEIQGSAVVQDQVLRTH